MPSARPVVAVRLLGHVQVCLGVASTLGAPGSLFGRRNESVWQASPAPPHCATLSLLPALPHFLQRYWMAGSARPVNQPLLQTCDMLFPKNGHDSAQMSEREATRAKNLLKTNMLFQSVAPLQLVKTSVGTCYVGTEEFPSLSVMREPMS